MQGVQVMTDQSQTTEEGAVEMPSESSMTEAREICAKLIPHTTSVHNAKIIAEALDAARAQERERCAKVATDIRCDDAAVMRIWRECDLPEWFLGNGGTNHKLMAFARRIREADLI